MLLKNDFLFKLKKIISFSSAMPPFFTKSGKRKRMERYN